MSSSQYNIIYIYIYIITLLLFITWLNMKPLLAIKVLPLKLSKQVHKNISINKINVEYKQNSI